MKRPFPICARSLHRIPITNVTFNLSYFIYTSHFYPYFIRRLFVKHSFVLAAKNCRRTEINLLLRDDARSVTLCHRDREERHWRCSARKKLLAIICGAYLNGCRRNDCCSYDWDNYIVPASWAAVTARCETRRDERERECRHRPERKRSCGIDNDINDDTITVVSSCTNSLYTIRTMIRRGSLYYRFRYVRELEKIRVVLL